MTSATRLRLLIAASASLVCSGALARDVHRPLKGPDIDALVARTMQAFAVPGVAIGIVQNGRLVYAKGYGVREWSKPTPVDPQTLFAIGSNTKAFTTAALAILVDEGKLHWDDRVVDHLPGFRMADPYVTREFTVRDLVTHRSGLGLGAGDLLFVTPTDFTAQDILHALPYLKPVTGFRASFAYDNLLYVVAGEVVAAASGLSWDEFVTSRILLPLRMSGCATATSRLADTRNMAEPHAAPDGRPSRVTRLDVPLVGPAGGVHCNVAGLATWVAVQLAQGRTAGGEQLFSPAQAEEMWSPQTPLRPSGRIAEAGGTHFLSYGLGWFLEDFEGYKRVSHSGGLPGMVSHVSMLPELGVGVVVLTNQQEGFALTAITNQILEGFTGGTHHDWLQLAIAEKRTQDTSLAAEPLVKVDVAGAGASLDAAAMADYCGVFSAATVGCEDGVLRLSISHTSALTGPLTPVAPDLFIVRWDDRELDADAYVRFSRDFDQTVVGFTMKPVSAKTDFSFDFQDLDFRRHGSGTVSPGK